MLKRLLMLIFLIPLFSYGQAGKIAGTITDAGTGEPLVGANVSLVNTNRGATADVNGDFVILNVPVGKYDLQFNYVGYKDALVKGVYVSADLTSDVNYAMQEGVVELGQEIVVVADRPMIRKDETNTNIITSAEQISQMPVRTLQDVASLAAGVVRAENSTVMNIRGGRGGESSIYIDGVLVNDPYNKAVRVDLPASAIEELSVQTGGFNAEYGESMSGIIVATTKAGTKNYSGMVEAVSDEFLLEDGHAFGLGTYSYGYNQYTMSVSGPVIPGSNHSFYVTGMRKYEHDRNPSWGHSENDFKPAAFKSATLPKNRNDVWSYSGKLSFKLTNDMELKTSAVWTDRKFDNFTGYYFYNTDHVSQTIQEHRSYNMSFTHAVNDKTFWEAKLNYFDSGFEQFDPFFGSDQGIEEFMKYGDPRFNPYPDEEKYYGINYASQIDPDFGGPGRVYDDYSKNRSTYMGADLSYVQQWNEHTIKAGFGFKTHTLRYYRILEPTKLAALDHNNEFEQWQAADVQFYGYDYQGKETDSGDYLDASRLADNKVNPADDTWKTQAPNEPILMNFYLQDKIELSDLVVNLGFRFDYIDPNGWQFKDIGPNAFGGNEVFDRTDVEDSEVHTFISPRLGISFPVTETTVFHAQYGKFFQAPNLEDLYISPFYMDNWASGGGYFTTLDNPNLKPPKTTSYEVGFRQMVGKLASLQLTAFYKETEDLTQVASVQTDITNVAFSNNGDFGTIKGFDIIFNLQSYKGVSARINYELQFARGTGSTTGSNFNIAWQGGPDGDYPKVVQPLDFEQRHTGSVNLNYRTEEGSGPNVYGIRPFENVGVNMLYTFNSGRPYTALELIGGQPYTGGNFNYPSEQPLSGVNSELTPWNHRVDFRLDRRINLDFGLSSSLIVYAEILNLFNYENVTSVWESTGSGNSTGYLSQSNGIAEYQNATDAERRNIKLREQDYRHYGVPRQMRLGARWEF